MARWKKIVCGLLPKMQILPFGLEEEFVSIEYLACNRREQIRGHAWRIGDVGGGEEVR